jgi:hypothetical protein
MSLLTASMGRAATRVTLDAASVTLNEVKGAMARHASLAALGMTRP